MSVKPIFIVGLPKDDSADKMKQTLRILENAPVGKEYNIIVYSTELTTHTFDVFYPEDFDDIKYAKLKEMVLKESKNG